MKPKTPKPRKMWAIYSLPFDNGNGISAHPSKSCADFYSWKDGSDVIIPVAIIPLDDVEALVERAAKAYEQDPSITFEQSTRAALTAAGIPCKQRRARK